MRAQGAPQFYIKRCCSKRKVETAARGMQGTGTFIVSETGTTVSTSQSRMMETFKAAGFPNPKLV